MSIRRVSAGTAVRNTVLVLVSLLWAVPTSLLLVNALVPASEYGGAPHWLPHGGFGLFDNMSEAWSRARLGPAMGNSLLYAVTSSAAAIVVATTAAFATVIMPVKRKTLWFWLIYPCPPPPHWRPGALRRTPGRTHERRVLRGDGRDHPVLLAAQQRFAGEPDGVSGETGKPGVIRHARRCRADPGTTGRPVPVTAGRLHTTDGHGGPHGRLPRGCR